MISPLLSNIYLHVLDTVWTRRYAHLGMLVRYADDFVVMCDTKAACEEAERVREVFARLGLELHPDKTRRVDLSCGREGFDFLGCHLRKRMSGPIWEKKAQACLLPPALAVSAQHETDATAREGTDASRAVSRDLRDIIADLNPVLRGWGTYFRTGNAAVKFNQVDDYVDWRLRASS